MSVKLRLKRHNDGWTKSTKNGIPWELKYVQNFDSKREALKRERFIKNQKNRSFTVRLINSVENEISWESIPRLQEVRFLAQAFFMSIITQNYC